MLVRLGDSFTRADAELVYMSHLRSQPYIKETNREHHVSNRLQKFDFNCFLNALKVLSKKVLVQFRFRNLCLIQKFA